MDLQSSSRDLVEIDLTQESEDDTDFTAEEDTEEEDDIKVEDLTQGPSTSTNAAADNHANNDLSTVMEEMDEDDESTESSDSIDDLIDDGESNKQTSSDPEEPSTSQPEARARVHEDESGRGARFIKYNQGAELEEGSSRSYVSDSWSELGDEEERQESVEALEAVIDEHFREALAALRVNNRDKAMRIFLSILNDPIVTKEFQVEQWTNFDWSLARTKTSNQRASNLSKIFFSANVAMTELVENPVPFYMQALSVRPEITELWYECGKSAAKLSDWSTAEFCFKQCNKNDFQAWESLLLLHFLQGDFHECFAYLQKLLAQFKNHRLASYIRCRISQSGPMWKEFCDKIFVDENFKESLDLKNERQITEGIANFLTKGSQNSGDAIQNPFVEVFDRAQIYAPLRLKLDLDMKAENLGSLLCDAFDRIEAFSLISEQSIIVEEKEDELNLLMFTDDETGVVEAAQQIELTNQPCNCLETDDVDFFEDLQRCVEELLDEMLDAVVDEKEYITAYTANENHLTILLHKNKFNKKQPTTMERNSHRLRRQFTQDGGTNYINSSNRSLFADDSVRCRRSTRFVEDLDISQFSLLETEGSSNKSDLFRLMGIPRTLEAPSSPLSKRLSVGATKNHLNSSIDCLNTASSPLPSVRKLAKNWVDASEMVIQNCLFGFLKWIAVDLQEEGFYSIAMAEADIFRQVYIRWSETFVGPLSNPSTSNVVWEEMCIHLLAAELGSRRALSLLQTYFATAEAIEGRCVQDYTEPQKSFSSSSVETPKNTGSVLETMDASSLDFFAKQVGIPYSDMKIMANLLNRMLEENNADASSGAIDATIQRLQRHSISEKAILLEEPLDRTSIKSDSPHPSPIYNPSLQRTIMIRYHWLVAQLKPEEIGLPAEGSTPFLHRYINILKLVGLMKDGERVRSHANFGNGCISLLNVIGLLYEQWRHFSARQIEHLKETEQYEDLQYALLHHFDWSEASEEVQIEQLFLLVECALKTNDLSLAVEYLLTIFKRLHQKALLQREAKQALNRGLNFFRKDINLAELSDSLVCGVGRMLAEMASSEQFYDSKDLWIICHRIAKHQEGDLSESDLVHFYEETASRQDEEDNCLPTRALMVLMKAHEALGEAQKCDQEEGIFLRFFLDEIAETMSLPAVQKALASNPKYSVIVGNVQVEVYQCINCAFSECKSLRKYDDHASNCKWQADWSLAQTILPLLLPHPLPLVYSLEKVSPDLVDVISRLFKFVLEVEPELETKLLEFCREPPVMELREVTDPDGIALYYAEDYQTDGDPRNFLTTNSKQYLVDVSQEKKEQLCLSAKCLYLSSLSQHRNNMNASNQDMMKVIRRCLAISNPYLHSQLQSSVWYMYARNLANEYIMLPSHQLVDQVDQFLFPFKMSIYLKPDFCEAHLDIATITYQVRTRIKRFSARSDVQEDKRKTARRKMDGMLLKCRVHFELAHKHNDSPAEVPWLSTYFLAKIAEKLGDSPEKIGKLYHESALALEQEGYLYPTKIHRSKQINFEPLEIHYKVHSYALKKVTEWKATNKFSLKSPLHSSCTTLHTLNAYLQLFAHHGVETKTASPHLFLKAPNLTGFHQPQSVKNSLEVDVLSTVSDMVDAVDLQIQIHSTCLNAFETIVSKFPHYKAYYRMAKFMFVHGDNKACNDLLFDRLLLPAGGAAKKRANATIITSSTTLFENLVEISRADIERSGSYAYHIHKILNLAIMSSFKCYDLSRLVLLLSSLATLHNEEQAPDKVAREDIKSLQTKCCNAIVRIAPLAKMNTEKLVHNCSLLQDLLRKLKKENNGFTTQIEDCLAKCQEKKAAWANRQQLAVAEQAARMQQQQQHQQMQAALVAVAAAGEKRVCSPASPPIKKREGEKIDVITLPETPPRPSTSEDVAASSSSSSQQPGNTLRAVIKQHLLQKSNQQQQAKKAVKRALDGQMSASHPASPPKKVSLVVDRNNLSLYFDDVLNRMPPEARTLVLNYIQDQTIDKQEKKQYVVKVLENAGFIVPTSPPKVVNGSGVAAAIPSPARPQQHQQQTKQAAKSRKRKVVLPTDPRLQTAHPNNAASRLPTLQNTLPTSCASPSTSKPIPRPVVNALAEVSSSSSPLANPAPMGYKPVAGGLNPSNMATDKSKRQRIQGPPKDGHQPPQSIVTKSHATSASSSSPLAAVSQQMSASSAQNIQEFLRLASFLPSSTLNEQTLAALRAATSVGDAKPVRQPLNNPTTTTAAASSGGSEAVNLNKQAWHVAHKPENLVNAAAMPSAQRPLHELPRSSFTSPSTHQQYSQFGRSQMYSQEQTHSPLARSKPTSLSQQPSSTVTSYSGQQQSQLSSFPSPFSSPISSQSSNSPRLSQKPPQRLTLPLKQATSTSNQSDHQAARLNLQDIVRNQKKKSQDNQVQRRVETSKTNQPAASQSKNGANVQQSNQLTQAQMQTHQMHLEKLQQYIRQQQQQSQQAFLSQQQSWTPLWVQQLSQQTGNMPLPKAGTSRKAVATNGLVEHGLADVATRFELQKLAFEPKSLEELTGRKN